MVRAAKRHCPWGEGKGLEERVGRLPEPRALEPPRMKIVVTTRTPALVGLGRAAGRRSLSAQGPGAGGAWILEGPAFWLADDTFSLCPHGGEGDAEGGGPYQATVRLIRTPPV